MMQKLIMLSSYIGDNLLLFILCETKCLCMCVGDMTMCGALD